MRTHLVLALAQPLLELHAHAIRNSTDAVQCWTHIQVHADGRGLTVPSCIIKVDYVSHLLPTPAPIR
jgi:hypothetical protein